MNDTSEDTETLPSTVDDEAETAVQKPSPGPRTPQPDPVDEEAAPGPRGRRALLVMAVSALVVVLLAVAAGVLVIVRTEHDTSQRDTAVTVAAREAVLALLTLDPENVQGSLDQLLASSTGGWRDQFAQQADQFIQIVRNGQVRATATITASAIQSADDNRATLLVLANAQISNVESPQGYPGVYRVLLSLERQDDRWLVSDLQFVA